MYAFDQFPHTHYHRSSVIATAIIADEHKRNMRLVADSQQRFWLEQDTNHTPTNH
tara:strand:- start:9658 stop:9822 length:165 start_codon:yes stop_codon:yes gene_type:complete